MTSKEQLAQAVVDALVEVAPDVDAATLEPDVPFREQFDFDSMDTLNFVTALHRTLGVDVPETDYPKLVSVASAVAYLEGRVGGA